MVVFIENQDSFSHIILDHFRRRGVEVMVVGHNTPPALPAKAQGIVLSPGPGRPENSGRLMDWIGLSLEKLPLLGVCLGHQAVGMHLGAKLINAPQPIHGKVRKVMARPDSPLFEGMAAATPVVRYHSLILESLPEVLKLEGESELGEIMAFSHNALPVWGVQFHPEAVLTQDGPLIFENWMRMAGIKFRSASDPNANTAPLMVGEAIL